MIDPISDAELASITVDPGKLAAGFAEPVAGPAISDTPSIEPSTGENVAPPPRPRGRARGAGMAAKQLSGIEAMLLAIHNSLKASFKIDELGLSPDEARELVNSYNEVCIYYPSLQLPAHIAAITGFCSCVSITYGSRIAAYRVRTAGAARPTARQPGAAPARPAPAAPPPPPQPANNFTAAPSRR